MGAIFKCFSTPGGYYVYDRYSNSVLRIDEHEFSELLSVETCNMRHSDSAVLKKYQKQGVMLEGKVDKIEHPETLYVKHICNNCISNVILQVTQQCNLRCSYCIYGGNYLNRKHGASKMNIETAKRAIDFALENSIESANLVISFYGGEPLIEFELIKQCVAYARSVIEGKHLLFNMTTNGTLLTDEIMRFLVENEFQILISLDGSKEEHDINRKFASGKGSFDTIMQNIRKFKEFYPEYVKQNVQFNAVMTPKTNLGCMDEFFSVNDVLADSNIIYNDVQSEGGGEGEANYNEFFWPKRKFETLKLMAHLVGKLDEGCVSKMVISQKETIRKFYRGLQEHKKIAAVNHHSGPCVPGRNRLLVSVDGKFYPCEKVSELPFSCIGSLENGIDIARAKEILNIGKITEDECKECWALRLCMGCLNTLCYSKGFSECEKKKCKLVACENIKNLVLSDLLEICILNEFNFIIPYEEE